jgi:hypothetical protein
MGVYHLLPWPLRGWCRRHLFNVVRKIDFGLLKIDPRGERPRLDAALRRDMLREFDTCLSARVSHEGGSGRIDAARGPLGRAHAWWKGTD